MTTTAIEPGLHADMPDAEYHAQHDYLSVSGAKKLLPPSCPAKFKAQQGLEFHKQTFDLGKAAHAKVLGKGADVVVVDALDWRSKDAREQRDAAYAEGKTPLLVAEAAQVDAMAASLAAHPFAGILFGDGEPEVSAFWTDAATGVQCRARFDWLPQKVDGKRLIVPDLKTALSAEPTEFARSAARFHYAMQDQWYCDAITALGIDEDPAFLFVVIEKEPPWIVTVGQLTEDDKKLGRALNDKARRIYAECLAADEWPTYSSEVADFALPSYHHYAYEEFLNS